MSFSKEKFLGFYSGNPNAEKAWDSVEAAYKQILSTCPTCHQPLQNQEVNPLIMAATMATIRTETGRTFNPAIKEIIAPEVAERNYGGRKDLGNIFPGDGAKFIGRGPSQLTGRFNYTKYGSLMGVDLINNPDLLLTPEYGFKAICHFFNENGLVQLAKQSDWYKIRKLYNGVNRVTGQPNGLDVFLKVIKDYLS
jgi:hypothetical protein